MEYDRQYMQKSYIIPEMIKNFLVYFQKSINDQNLYEIQNAYENGFVYSTFVFQITFKFQHEVET